ncbi:hypothetical protein [Paenibacillus sp. FSL L8-0463]|uniref:hypothetical protein n=1 Tax=Paenibacillus sp. FSL L8-0463 TaxID=2954687 RepID=UPI0031199A6A
MEKLLQMMLLRPLWELPARKCRRRVKTSAADALRLLPDPSLRTRAAAARKASCSWCFWHFFRIPDSTLWRLRHRNTPAAGAPAADSGSRPAYSGGCGQKTPAVGALGVTYGSWPNTLGRLRYGKTPTDGALEAPVGIIGTQVPAAREDFCS